MVTVFSTTADPTAKENINQMFRDLHSKGLVSNEDFAATVARNIRKDPFELWSWVAGSSMGVEDSSGFADS